MRNKEAIKAVKVFDMLINGIILDNGNELIYTNVSGYPEDGMHFEIQDQEKILITFTEYETDKLITYLKLTT